MASADYNRRQGPRAKRTRRGGSGFFWFVTGAVAGAFAVALAWMLEERGPASVPADPQARAEPPAKPSFVFHQLLPEMEVLVPDEELAAAPPTPKPPAKPSRQGQSPQAVAKPSSDTTEATRAKTSDGASYLIQVASFRQGADAERLKAKLALLGIRARIQRVTVNGKAYHRVRAGPYQGKRKVNDTRALLSGNGLESIAIKLK